MNHDFITAVSRMTTPKDVADAIETTYPNLGYTRSLTYWALGPDRAEFDWPDFTPTDRLFVDAICAHKAFRAGQRRVSAIIDVGREFDPVGRNDLIDNWSAAKLLCYLVASQTVPRHRCAAVVGMRDEGVTALDWVAHYRAIGVERIFVYTNSNSDGTDVILERLALNDQIVLIRNDMAPDVYPQFKIYEHFLTMLPEARNFEWCCFFDSDELFVPGSGQDRGLIGLLEQAAAAVPDAGAIWYPWRWMVSDNCFSRAPKPLATRFQHGYKHSLVKSIAKLTDIISLKPLHSPYLRTDRVPIDAKFARRSIGELFEVKDWPEDTGRLHHYWCKSFEEFYLKKRRGDSIEVDDNAYKRDLETFFAWNGQASAMPDCRMPALLSEAIEVERKRLCALPGIAAAVAASDAAFRRLVATDGSGKPLRLVYEEMRIAAGASAA